MNAKQILKQEDIEVIVANASKPPARANFPYPLNDLDDRVFEILTYSLYKRRLNVVEPHKNEEFDDVQLMQGVGEKGIDLALTKSGKIVGVVQCKKYARNLSDTHILNELLKFVLHRHLEPDRFAYTQRFKYAVVTSTGFTGKAINLLEVLKDRSVRDKYDLRVYVDRILRQYKAFKNLLYEDVEEVLPELLSKLDYELVRPIDINLWINSHPEVIGTFFEIKTIVTAGGNAAPSLTKRESKSDVASKDIEKIINDFLRKYRKVAVDKLDSVNFTGFDLHKHRRRPDEAVLSDLFVQPSFQQRPASERSKVVSAAGTSLTIPNVFNSEKHIVLLGDPGSGKSLLVKYIIVQLLNGNADRMGLRQYARHLPFRIELRKYNDHLGEKNVVQYLTMILNNEYQLKLSENVLGSIMEDSDSLFFFDGLDEIFEATQKQRMKEAIDAFTKVYPRAKCIITSRFIGYHDISFPANRYAEFAIQKFDRDRVIELVERFYSTQIAHEGKRQTAIEHCTLQLDRDVDDGLKSNPLILTLILILTYNNIVIPESKLEVYEACTKTLVDTLDARKEEMKIVIPVRNKRLTFAHLAHWQYESISTAKPVSYVSAVKSLASLFQEKGEAREYTEAEDKAKRFLEYAEKRSIYFENNFTHKTFLEYYTADYIYINYFTRSSDAAKQKAIGLIATYLPQPFWYIVFELLLTRIDKEQADTELLDEIINAQIRSSSLDVFYFLINNLPRLVNVSDVVRKSVIKKTLQLCLNGARRTEIKRGLRFEESSLPARIYVLQQHERDCQLLQEVLWDMEWAINSEKEQIEFYVLFFELMSLNAKMGTKTHLRVKNKARLRKLALKNLHLFSHVYVAGPKLNKELDETVLVKQIKHFGTNSIFNNLSYLHRERVQRMDTFDLFLVHALRSGDVERVKRGLGALRQHGVNDAQVLRHVGQARLGFLYRNEGLHQVLDALVKSDDAQLNKILLKMLRSAPENRLAYQKYRQTNSSKKLAAVDRLFGLIK